jgi:hypothetical protein
MSGASLANQHTAVLFILPFVLCVLWEGGKKEWGVGALAATAGCFLVGFVPPYAAMGLIMMSPPCGSWGLWHSAADFWNHLLRREYGTFSLGGANTATREGGIWLRLGLYFDHQVATWGWPAVLLAGCGLASLAWRKPSAGVVLGFSLSIYLLVIHGLANLPFDDLHRGVMERFWIQPQLILSMGFGVEFSRFSVALLRLGPEAGGEALRVGICVAGLAMVVRLGFDTGTSLWWQRDDRVVYDLGELILQELPINATVLLSGDAVINSVRYLQAVEGKRPDLRALFIPLMTHRWFIPAQGRCFRGVVFPGAVYGLGQSDGFGMKRFVEANSETPGGLFLCGEWHAGDKAAEESHVRWPWGICDKLVPSQGGRHSNVNLVQWMRESAARLRWPVPGPGRLAAWGPTSWESTVAEFIVLRNHTRAHFMLTAVTKLGIPLESKVQVLWEVARAYRELLVQHPVGLRRPAFYWKNAGMAYHALSEAPRGKGVAKAKAQAEASSWLVMAIAQFKEYLRHAPGDGDAADRAQIRAFLAKRAG